MEKKILGMGNAVLDILTSASDDYLKNNKLSKGSMYLVEQKKSDDLLKKIKPIKKDSGGSVANTIVGISILGLPGFFCGKVKNDKLGKDFARNIEETGVNFLCKRANAGMPTARCLVFVTPDGERTMQTFLGASTTLDERDISENFFEEIKYLLIEGYLWSSESARRAIKKAITIAKKNGIEVIFSLSDQGLATMYKKDFLKLIKENIDILIGNEQEYKGIFDTNNAKEIFAKIGNFLNIGVITSGNKGATIFSENKVETVKATKIDKVIDTTGAGDMFAAGFLYKLLNEVPAKQAGIFGCKTAGRIIRQYGARPDKETFKNI